MGVFTDYYRMQQVQPVTKSHRYDCTVSTESYAPFETIRRASKSGRFFFYLKDGAPQTFRSNVVREANMTITNRENISGIYVPDPCTTYTVGYGDTKGTTDALLFIFTPDNSEIEIFVARGKKYSAKDLYFLHMDGEFSDEIKALRERAFAKAGIKL